MKNKDWDYRGKQLLKQKPQKMKYKKLIKTTIIGTI